jgi:predicted PurR-regulated permease PerM
MDKDIRISITSGTIVSALIVLACAYVLWILRDLVLLVLTAIVIASAIEPGIAFFIRYHVPRFFGALLMYVLIFGSIFALAYFLFPPVISDATGFLSTAPQYLEAIRTQVSQTTGGIATSFATSASGVSSSASEAEGIRSFIEGLISLQAIFSTSSSGALQLFATFFGGILSLVLVVVLSFYFALQDTGVDDFLRLILPLNYENYAVDLWRRAQKKIGLWMQGQVMLSVIMGILVYLGLLIIGVPYALLLAVLTAFGEIVPVFGSLIAGIIAVAVGYSDGGVALAAIVAGLYIVVNQFESNLIYPLIVKKIVGIPPLLVILALIAGYTLGGFLGVLLSVPLAAVLLEFITDLDKRKRAVQ